MGNICEVCYRVDEYNLILCPECNRDVCYLHFNSSQKLCEECLLFVFN